MHAQYQEWAAQHDVVLDFDMGERSVRRLHAWPQKVGAYINLVLLVFLLLAMLELFFLSIVSASERDLLDFLFAAC